MKKVKSKASKKKPAKVLAGSSTVTVMKKVPMLKAWSYSRLHDYDVCPAKAMYKHVIGLKEPAGPALERGIRIHQEAEDFLSGKTRKPPESFNEFQPLLMQLRKQKAMGERSICLNRMMKPVPWDAWEEVWLRVKLDALLLLKTKKAKVRCGWFYDFKTGKVYEDDHYDQLDLYALSVFAENEDVQELEGELWYVDQPGLIRLVRRYTRAVDLPRLTEKWLKRSLPLLSDRKFAPNPGDHCRYCHFRKSNQGPCRF